jgi:hypothetical protein
MKFQRPTPQQFYFTARFETVAMNKINATDYFFLSSLNRRQDVNRVSAGSAEIVRG